MCVSREESKYLAGRVSSGWFVYTRLLFGIVSGPLLWGRTAALVMRATAALLKGEKARLQCYVDDPIFIFAGSEAYKKKLLHRILAYWVILGFRFSWNKAQRGTSIEWIGAAVKTKPGEDAFVIGVPKDKTDKSKVEPKETRGSPRKTMKHVVVIGVVVVAVVVVVLLG